MKKLLSTFMASALLLGATNLTALAGGLISKPSTDTAVASPLHTQEEIESIFSHVRFVLWSDWYCRHCCSSSFFGIQGHEDVNYSTDGSETALFVGHGTSVYGPDDCKSPPVDRGLIIDTHVEGVSASFIPVAFYNSDEFQCQYNKYMHDLTKALAAKGVIAIPEADDQESYFDDVYRQLQEYFNGNTAATLDGYPAWLAKQFINKFNLRQQLKQFDIPENPNCYFLIIEEHSQNKSEGSTFHIELLNGSKLFNDRVCNEALYHLDELIYAKI